MINIISALLQDEKYNLIRHDNKILLYRENLEHYPEDYIQIESEPINCNFIVSEVHRDTKQVKFETEKAEDANIYAVVLYKRWHDNIVNKTKVRDIRNYIDAGEEKKALGEIISSFGDSLFCVDREDDFKISLIHTGDKVDIMFGGEYIVEKVTLSRGYVVFYNYCEKLRYICEFYDKICKRINCTINRETILKVYILG